MSRRACPSRRRGPGRATCSRRCARAARPASRGPGLRGNGRQRKFWSSESAPPYGSPWRRFTFIRSRSAGESTTRCERCSTRDSGCAARAAPGCGPRSAPAAVRPRAVADVELARGVALHAPRQLLQLDPEQPLARPARATDRSSAAGRRRSSPPPAAGRARPRSRRARRRRARA